MNAPVSYSSYIGVFDVSIHFFSVGDFLIFPSFTVKSENNEILTYKLVLVVTHIFSILFGKAHQLTLRSFYQFHPVLVTCMIHLLEISYKTPFSDPVF